MTLRIAFAAVALVLIAALSPQARAERPFANSIARDIAL